MDDSVVLAFQKLGVSAARTADKLKEALVTWALYVDSKQRSNNWLRMHGYPMRRKGRKGSKKS